MKLLTKIFSFFSFDHMKAGSEGADAFFRTILRSKQEMVSNGETFYVDVEFSSKYPELHTMIFNTASMSKEERQYWFDVMHMMTGEQIDRLFDILETERIKLEKLEENYDKEISAINAKHLAEWQEFRAKEKEKKEDLLVKRAMDAVAAV